MKTSKTKKRFLLSMVAVIACVAMLIGTTFAWFTDSETSGKNKIVAGNLDIELEYTTDGENWTPVTETTKLFKVDALWEPGYTEVAYLRLSNKGNLALKYNLGVNVESEVEGTNVAGTTFKLSDYLKMGVVDTWDGTVYADRAAARAAVANADPIATYTKPGSMVAGAPAETFAIVVYMPEEVGNEANPKTGTTPPSIDLGVRVVATQLTSEEDSFDDQYDKNLLLAGEELKETIEAAPADKITEVWLENDVVLTGKIVIPDKANIVIHGENQKIYSNGKLFEVLGGTNADITVSDADFIGKGLSGNYAVCVGKNYSGKISIVSSSFNNMMCGVMIDDKGSGSSTLTLKNNDFSGALWSYSLQKDNASRTVIYTDNIDGMLGEKELFDSNKPIKVAEGFYANAKTYTAATEFYIVSKEGLKYFAAMTNREVTPPASFGGPDTTNHMFSGKTVILKTNVDLNNEQWTPIGYNKNVVGGKAMFAGTFDGANHIIKNLYVNNTTVKTKNDYLAGLFGSLNSAVTVQNLTIDNAKVYNVNSYSGALAGQTYNTGAKIINIKVCGDIDVTAANHAGTLLGYNMGTIENCVVNVNAGSNVTSAWHIGGLCSLANTNTVINNCSVKGITLNTTNGGAAGIVGYYKNNIKITNCTVTDVAIVMPEGNVETKAGPIYGFIDEETPISPDTTGTTYSNVTINGVAK